MTSTDRIRPAAPQPWVLVANAARARCFARDDENNAMRELAGFVHPESRMKGEALMHDRGGLAHKGVASTQFQPHTDPHEREHAVFARELAQYLEDGALAHRYPAVSLFASAPFLGELRTHLGAATQKLLRASMALDLTGYEGAELEQRVAQALQAPTA
jgi:protein required for attachment to host cells